MLSILKSWLPKWFAPTELAPGPVAPPGQIMKLSQAIREGSKLRPPTSHLVSSFWGGRSCAGAAAAEATGFRYDEDASWFAISDHLEERFPGYRRLHADFCAKYGQSPWLAGSTFGWTRERIADELEALGG